MLQNIQSSALKLYLAMPKCILAMESPGQFNGDASEKYMSLPEVVDPASVGSTA